jgi:predicted patatin/cPLA2 family phospholipase
MATSAIPVVFPFVEWRNSTYVDGGGADFMDVIGGI